MGSPQGDVTIYLQEEPMNEENCVGNTVPRGAARIEILENVKKRKNFFVRDSSASIVAERLFKIDRRRKSEKHSGN